MSVSLRFAGEDLYMRVNLRAIDISAQSVLLFMQ